MLQTLQLSNLSGRAMGADFQIPCKSHACIFNEGESLSPYPPSRPPRRASVPRVRQPNSQAGG